MPNGYDHVLAGLRVAAASACGLESELRAGAGYNEDQIVPSECTPPRRRHRALHRSVPLKRPHVVSHTVVTLTNPDPIAGTRH